ncbi:MAG: glutaredoxin family protein [Deltaproteobacteria bacterium]|nr:glutaredoxin family protein [Deltaproteobacteria bacterium]
MKEFLSEQSIPFVSKDISQDPQALEDLVQRGVATTPVTLIGSQVVVGFNPAEILKAVGR